MTQTSNPYPEKTARWWFHEYLPEPYKSQAIENSSCEPYEYESLLKSISHDFTWTTSSEGFGYWSKLQDAIIHGEFSTPNHPSPTVEQKKAANFTQWKGTDICMDLHCECGHHNHYDGDFAYAVQCANCKQIYKLAETVEMVKVDTWDNPLQSNEH